MQFDGKVAMVTGGASGIGAATAELLSRHGARVWLADRNREGMEGLRDKLGSATATIELDVTSESAWRRVISQVMSSSGRIDVLVNAAGISRIGRPIEIEHLAFDEWRAVLAVNLDGTFLGCKGVIPALRQSGGGTIVNIASTVADAGSPTLAAYGASKAGVLQLTKSVAIYCALRGDPVRCNAVLPGMTNTAMNAAIPPAAREAWEQQIPMHRFGRADEVAAAIAFLASDASSYINGAGLVIDGGFQARSGVDYFRMSQTRIP
jgi:3(or 17)beta-hydroxysteroid dehydrogenase